MLHTILPDRTKISYVQYGSGSPLVLVHGGFSDHISNWEFVKPLFEQQFTVYAVPSELRFALIARRGRGETDATVGHSLDDESHDVLALIQSIDEPVFLLGHSYGAQVALAAAIQIPDRIRKLVLYEAPYPQAISKTVARLEALAQANQWDDFVGTFFHESLFVPLEKLDQLRATELWSPLIT